MKEGNPFVINRRRIGRVKRFPNLDCLCPLFLLIACQVSRSHPQKEELARLKEELEPNKQRRLLSSLNAFTFALLVCLDYFYAMTSLKCVFQERNPMMDGGSYLFFLNLSES